MPKWTPGPWQIGTKRGSDLDVIFDNGDFRVANIPFVYANDDRLSEIGKANAKLIAKAPEMYELLKKQINGEVMLLDEMEDLIREIDHGYG